MTTHDHRAPPLWPLPLAAGLIPVLATVLAYALSIRLDLVPACNPFLDGCVSISRAARHDLPNILFRALMLPAAVLQAATWSLATPWLRSLGATPDAWQRTLPWLGVFAGVFLILYGTFLGTEGAGYRWMRRYGVIFYFGLTCICILIASGQLQRYARDAGPLRLAARGALAICIGLVLLGLVHVFVPLALPGAAVKDALENVTEWWGGALFSVFFFVLAWGWRTTGFAAALRVRGG